MGGYGSGRHSGQPTVEGCRSLVLDINRLIRPVADALHGRHLGRDDEVRIDGIRLAWTRDGDDIPWAELWLTLVARRDEATATLRFDVDHSSRRTGLQTQHVQIESTPCRFGGRRWWWVCPATGRRCAKLYLPNGGTRFLSRGRGAYRLVYASQRLRAIDRSHNRLARVCRKMGGAYRYSTDLPPPRPKGMRTATYARLLEEWEAAQTRHDRLWLAGTTLLLRRLQRGGPLV